MKTKTIPVAEVMPGMRIYGLVGEGPSPAVTTVEHFDDGQTVVRFRDRSLANRSYTRATDTVTVQAGYSPRERALMTESALSAVRAALQAFGIMANYSSRDLDLIATIRDNPFTGELIKYRITVTMEES